MSHGRRVVIDALAARFGGTAYAAVHLARLLAREPEIERLVVVARAGSIVSDGLLDAPQVELVQLPRARVAELARRLRWEASRLPELVEAHEATDVISLSGILPRRPAADLTLYLLNPVPFQRPGFGSALRKWAITRTARSAASVVVPSQAMGELVEPTLRRRPTVVPLGIHRAVFQPAAAPGDQILVVADFYRHKRHDVVLDAWRRLREPRPLLRLIGNPAPDEVWADRVRATVERMGAADGVIIEHGLGLSELAQAYRDARVFLLPSEHESFCMPLAEALASGVPGLVRGTPVLRETAGPGAVFVDEDDPDVWAAGLQRLMDDDAHHAELREAGLRYAQRYSFEQMARGVVDNLGSTKPNRPRAGRAGFDPRPWLLPASLSILLALVLVSGVIARQGGTVAAGPTAPVVETAFYGEGLTELVKAPVGSLVAAVGPNWRRLEPPAGRANLNPSGTRGTHFQVGFVVYVRRGRGRLQFLTSQRDSRVIAVPRPETHMVVNLGPFKAAAEATLQGIALFPLPPSADAAPPDLILSPLEAKWLQPGEAVLRQESLLEPGPGDLRGQWVPVGVSTAVPVTPGVTGVSDVEVVAATERGRATLEVRVGGTRHTAAVTPEARIVRLGPVPAASRISFRFDRVDRNSPSRVMLASLALRPRSGG